MKEAGAQVRTIYTKFSRMVPHLVLLFLFFWMDPWKAQDDYWWDGSFISLPVFALVGRSRLPALLINPSELVSNVECNCWRPDKRIQAGGTESKTGCQGKWDWQNESGRKEWRAVDKLQAMINDATVDDSRKTHQQYKIRERTQSPIDRYLIPQAMLSFQNLIHSFPQGDHNTHLQKWYSKKDD